MDLPPLWHTYEGLTASKEVEDAIGANVPYPVFLKAYLKIRGLLSYLLEEEGRFGHRIGSTSSTRIIDEPLFDNSFLISRLSIDSSDSIRALLATKTEFPEGLDVEELFFRLARDKSPKVRIALAKRSVFPDEVNTELIADALLDITNPKPEVQLAVYENPVFPSREGNAPGLHL